MGQEDEILENASAPKKVKSDGQEVEQHSIADQIAADKYARKLKAAKARRCPVTICKIRTPGGGTV